MKIGVISDTHIPDRANKIPDEILKEFKKMDMVIHAGDLVDLRVLDELIEACPNVKAVFGNMDQAEIKKRIPEKEIIQINNFKIGITHGRGAPSKLVEFLKTYFSNDDVDMIIFGHSHMALNEKIGDVLFFNPGSATDKTFSTSNSYGIVEINDRIEARIIKI